MRFSTRTRYGLRFCCGWRQPKDSLLQLGQVAREENISSGYLEQIVRALKPLGILRAVRGSGGGYALAKDPSEINMEDVFLHLEGEIAPVRCLTKGRCCQREQQCSTWLLERTGRPHPRILAAAHSPGNHRIWKSIPLQEAIMWNYSESRA